MKRIYLDNAATTPLSEEVFEAMTPYLLNHYGNPSSIHGHGRDAKSAIEASRKTIAGLINVKPSEVYFTSGGTEADNLAIKGLCVKHELKNIICSPIEHHAVLHTVEFLQKQLGVNVHYLNVNDKGDFDLDQLRQLTSTYPKSLITVMHANNEIGNLAPVEEISIIAKEFDCFYHSDTVQSLGHLPIDLSQWGVDAICGSAHKIHGPKGTGVMVMRKNLAFDTMIAGGSQEQGARGGTENVAGIVGYAKALEMSYENLEKDTTHIKALKKHAIQSLREKMAEVEFNGRCSEVDDSLYTVLNVLLPNCSNAAMILFSLDLKGISVSGGSACSSGALKGSHVLNAIGSDQERPAVRMSFSKFTTIEEVDYAVSAIAELCSVD